MKRVARLALAIVAALASIGCGGTGSDAEQSQGRVQGLSLEVRAFGNVPIPVESDGSVPRLENGEPVQNWDGTSVELIAADAWAECSYQAPLASINDQYLIHLQNLTSSATCANTNLAGNPAGDWYYSRRDPACNVDPTTFASTALPPVSRSTGAYAVTAVNLNNTATTRAARNWAQAEVSYAEQNLCMARRLAEYLDGASALFASADEQLELLNVVRHRAQAAVLQYSFISKVPVGLRPLGASTRSLPTDAQYLRLLRRWFDSLSPIQIEPLGSDFAAAIDLHIRVTDQLGRLMLRVGSQRSAGAAIDRPTADWGQDAGRTRLLKLLYGGDSSANAPQPFDTSYDGALLQRHQFVREDVRRPQVGILLGLARRANALLLRRSEQPFTATPFAQTFNGFNLDVDVSASAGRIYQDVERDLRKHQCDLGKAEFCAAELPASAMDFLLQRLHGVRPEDADSLVRQLGDAIPSRTRVLLGAAPTEIFVFTGAFHVPGVHVVTDDPNEAGASWVRLDPGFSVTPLAAHEQSQVYYRSTVAPRNLDLLVAGPWQGMNAVLPQFFGPGAFRWDEFGTVPVLAIAREAIELGLRGCVDRPCLTLFEHANAARPVLDGALGPRSLALRPVLETVPSSAGGCLGMGWVAVPGSGCGSMRTKTSGSGSSQLVEWTLDTVTHTNDDFDQVAYGVGNEPLRAAALTRKHVGFFGETRATLEALPVVTAEESASRGEILVRRHRFSLAPRQPVLFSGSQNVVFLKRASGNDFTSVRIFDSPANEDTWIASSYGGGLNALAEDARRVQAANWSMPERDGFGIPYDWIPPADVSLAGGSSGEDSVSYYLRIARRAAEDATTAVQTAINTLKEEALNEATLQASEKKAATITQLEQQSLCGSASEASCQLGVADWEPLPDLPVCLDIDPVKAAACSIIWSQLRPMLPESFVLAKPVVEALGPAPTFAAFQGGTLQRLLIAQWNAQYALKAAISDSTQFAVAKATERAAAEAVIAAAQSQLSDAQRIATSECSADAFKRALEAGQSFSSITSNQAVKADGNGGFHWNVTSKDAGKSWSPGPLYAQGNACQQAKDQLGAQNVNLPVQVAQATASVAASWAAQAAQLASVSQARGALVQTVAEIAGAQQQATTAVARADLETSLAAIDVQTRYALKRRYQSYDLWRARALLESARKLSVTARRAIEGRFGVDLSQMNAPESFVAAPALWADEVYGTDLDAPSAVGLTQLVNQTSQIYPNKLVDYVGNLELFVEGYAVTRPTSVARGDTELLSLPAPAATALKTVDAADVAVLDSSAAGWVFYCANTDSWIAHPGMGEVPLVTRLATACGGEAPTKARLSFSLDPWGRLNGDYALPPFNQRHNARWSRLAVNIVGTGIRDCARSNDPLTCYNEAFLRYDLRHAGPAWITNYAQDWRSANIPAAFIEGGKALAAEEWLDPISNTWTTPLVANIARQELIERPVGGEYQLVLELTPEVRIERIERIQLLVETNYWVSQTP